MGKPYDGEPGGRGRAASADSTDYPGDCLHGLLCTAAAGKPGKKSENEPENASCDGKGYWDHKKCYRTPGNDPDIVVSPDGGSGQLDI